MNDLLRCLIREMAQAQTRKLGIPRVSKIDKLKELVSDPPQYAIRFTDLERPGNDVTMSWDEGHGTFMFPLTSEVYSALIRNQIGFSNGYYAHIFKIPKYILIVGKNENDIGDDEVESLIREMFDRKKIRISKLFLSKMFSKPEFSTTDADDVVSALMGVYLKEKAKIGSNSSLYKLKDFFKLPAFSKALMNLGIDGFMDLGTGFIYSSMNMYENSQLIVTNPRALHWVETFNTRDLLSFRNVIRLNKSSSEEYYDKIFTKYPDVRGRGFFLKMLATENLTKLKVERTLAHIEKNADFIETIRTKPGVNDNSDILEVGCILYRLCLKCQLNSDREVIPGSDHLVHYVPKFLTINDLKRIRKLVEGAGKQYYDEFTTALPNFWNKVLEVT